MPTLTKTQIIKEIVRCGRDPIYFINNYVSIVHQGEGRGRMLFKTFAFQDQMIRDLQDYRWNIILKARQIGASTIVQAYCLWLILFHPEKEVLVLSTKLPTASKFVKKSKRMYQLLPEWLKIAKDTINNRQSIELDNGSTMTAGSSAVDASRSEALSLLVVDEAAIIENMEEIWTSAKPTLSTGGRCIALSTPFGCENWFYHTFSDAEDNLNDFHASTYSWNTQEERDEKWLENETRGWDKRKIAQEFLCSFLSSGMTVVDPEAIIRIEKDDIREPKFKSGFDRNVFVWEEPQQGVPYLIAADVARGDGEDHSTFLIFNTLNMHQVAEYKGKPESDIFATMLFSYGMQYGGCLVVVENNTYGFAVLKKLIDMQYPNVYYHERKTHEYIEQIIAEHREDCVPGFFTNQTTRPLLIAKMEEFVRNGVVTVRSSRLIKEMRTFIWKNGRPEAQKGTNDDLIIPLGIACWVRDTALIKNQRDIEYKKAFIDAMFCTRSKMNTSIPGMDSYNKKENVLEEPEEPIEKQFMWLYRS